MSPVTFDSLKKLKLKSTDLITLTRIFPSRLISNFTQFLVITENGQWSRLYQDTTDAFNFNINIGVAIRDDNYLGMGEVIVRYFEQCRSMQNGVMHTIKFNDEAKLKFISICDEYQGKKWDDIIDNLCDELLILVHTATINGRYLYGDN